MRVDEPSPRSEEVDMARVKLSKVLDRVSSETRHAMADALRSVAPHATVDADALAREFIRRLQSRASSYVRVDDSYVEAE
jgi:hypothetical protein